MNNLHSADVHSFLLQLIRRCPCRVGTQRDLQVASRTALHHVQESNPQAFADATDCAAEASALLIAAPDARPVTVLTQR